MLIGEFFFEAVHPPDHALSMSLQFGGDSRREVAVKFALITDVQI